MLPDSILPTPEDDIARVLRDYERRLSHLETLEGAAGGAWTLIEDIDLAVAAANFDFQNIAATFRSLRLICMLRSAFNGAETADNVLLRLNNDAGGNYDDLREVIRQGFSTVVDNNAAAFILVGSSTAANSPADAFAELEIRIPFYADTSFDCTLSSRYSAPRSEADAAMQRGDNFGKWRNTSAVNRVTLFLNSASNFVAGSRASLYGIT